MFRLRNHIAALTLALALITMQGNAQTSLSINDAVTFALSHRLELRAASDRINSSKDLRAQAGLIPNPRLFFQTEDLRTSDFNFWQQSETYIYASESLETSGRRGARIAVASQGIERSRIAESQVRRQIELRVRQAYLSAEAARILGTLYKQSDDYFRQIIAYHEARFHEGKLPEVDLLRVRLEGARVQSAAAKAQIDADRAFLDLNREIGAPEDSKWKLTDDFEALETPAPLPIGADSALLRPEGQASQQAIAQARANLRLQKANGRPDLDLLLGYKRDVGYNTAFAGLQLDLPVFNRNQKAVAAAQADTQAAEEDYAAMRHQLSSELVLARREYEYQRDQYLKTFKPLRDQAVEISNISRAAYQEGGLDLVRLLDAERVRIEAEVSWVQALEGYHQSVASLDYAEGIEP